MSRREFASISSLWARAHAMRVMMVTCGGNASQEIREHFLLVGHAPHASGRQNASIRGSNNLPLSRIVGLGRSTSPLTKSKT